MILIISVSSNVFYTILYGPRTITPEEFCPPSNPNPNPNLNQGTIFLGGNWPKTIL